MALSRFPASVAHLQLRLLGAGVGASASWPCFRAVAGRCIEAIGALGWAAAAVAWLECGGPSLAGSPSDGSGRPGARLLPPSWLRRHVAVKELSQTLRIPKPGWWTRSSRWAWSAWSRVRALRCATRRLEPQYIGRAATPEGVFFTARPQRADPIRRARDAWVSRSIPRRCPTPAAPAARAGAGCRRRADVLQAHITAPADRCGGAEPPGSSIWYGTVRGLFGRRLFGIARVHVAEARVFVAASEERYDLIQVALLDSSSPRPGLYALSENYLYTGEAGRMI